MIRSVVFSAVLALAFFWVNQREYFSVSIHDLAAGKNFHTHIRVRGKVTYVKHEADGDTHLRLEDGKDFVVAECIPMLPCPFIPKVGQTLTVWGISRVDGEHKWHEVHPVERMKLE